MIPCPFCHKPTLSITGNCSACGIAVPDGGHPGPDNERYKWGRAEYSVQRKASRKRPPPAKVEDYRPEEK